jgi:diguanylate cyclase (GGDEF)-like protein
MSAHRVQSLLLNNQEYSRLQECDRLRQAIAALKQENEDLKIALSITSEHGDCVESELHTANHQLQNEIFARRRAETMLQMLLEAISSQKQDLEIVLQILMDHGDSVDTQWCQKLAAMTQLAAIDGLTQIANRRRFDDYLAQQWKQMMQAQLPLSIVLCDIDCFKQFNDTYGHLVGDECLKQIAQSLSHLLKHPDNLVARYGGEEFVVILPQTDLQAAKAVAEQIQAEIQQLSIPNVHSSASPLVTVSIGVASVIPNPQIQPLVLLSTADQLLYRAKQQGRNQIMCIDEH